jgi:hypothetical protein
MRFIIMQFSPRSVFLAFRSKYLPQHSFLRPCYFTFRISWLLHLLLETDRVNWACDSFPDWRAFTGQHFGPTFIPG